MTENGTHVERREMGKELDLIRAEQKTEHFKTRALVVLMGLPGATKALSVLGVIHLPHLF